MFVSVFNLLSTNGEIIFLSLLLFLGSPSLSIGTANSLLNVDHLYRYPLFKKSMIDHKSESLFSTGVPVNATLYSALRVFIYWVCFEALFLMFCASSNII